jgi:hypothetical protein
MALDELTWEPLVADDPSGTAIARPWGEPFSEAFGALLCVPANFESYDGSLTEYGSLVGVPIEPGAADSRS